MGTSRSALSAPPELKLGYQPQKDTDFLNLNNIFKLEVARCKLGRPNFNSWIDEINYNESLRAELGIQSRVKLTERSYKRNLEIVSLSLNEYADISVANTFPRSYCNCYNRRIVKNP